jgi:hypothetical protein
MPKCFQWKLREPLDWEILITQHAIPVPSAEAGSDREINGLDAGLKANSTDSTAKLKIADLDI